MGDALRGIRESNRLLVCGTVLFLLGLVNGVLVPVLPDHQRAVSAHVTALQDGIVLWAFGLMWHRVSLGTRLRSFISAASIYSMYAIWLGIALTAFATGNAAAPGHVSSLRAAVGALEASGSLAILAACLGLLAGLRGSGQGVSGDDPMVGQRRPAGIADPIVHAR